jgi:hypothetical protein
MEAAMLARRSVFIAFLAFVALAPGVDGQPTGKV